MKKFRNKIFWKQEIRNLSGLARNRTSGEKKSLELDVEKLVLDGFEVVLDDLVVSALFQGDLVQEALEAGKGSEGILDAGLDLSLAALEGLVIDRLVLDVSGQIVQLFVGNVVEQLEVKTEKAV